MTARLMVIVAHPDDETIGAGGLLARCTDARVVVVTDGAPRNRELWAAGVNAQTQEEYAAIRRDELRLAMADVGIGPDRVHLLGFTDGEITERIPVVAARLTDLVKTLNPEVVLAPAYEGGHVDHDATALAVHAALRRDGRGHAHEMALYHAAGSDIAVHRFLPTDGPVLVTHLDPGDRARKAGMLERYVSQKQYAAYFDTKEERFRCAPAYDFRQSPTPGRPLLYERSNPGRGDHWRQQTAPAIARLELDARPPDEAPGLLPVERHSAALVSIIVRTVGRETLTAALESIRCQTHPTIEIVLVDVGGHGLPSSWQGRDGLTIRLCAANGLERAAAANAGLAAARGDYIAFLDDDDWYHPEHVASLVAALRGASDAKLAYAGVEVIECQRDLPPRRRWVFDAPYDPIALLCENYIPLNAILVERSVLDGRWRFDESLAMYEDWDFLIWLSKRTRFEKVSGIGAVYRWPPGSGVNDPALTGAAQEQVFTKWQAALTPVEHVALMRRAIAQTKINERPDAPLRQLQMHLKAVDEELAHARTLMATREQRLRELESQLGAQRAELERARTLVQEQERQLSELRPHLAAQDAELEQLRERVAGTLESHNEALRREVDDLQEQLVVMRAAVSRMIGSWSWRLTRPLRALHATVFKSSETSAK